MELIFCPIIIIFDETFPVPLPLLRSCLQVGAQAGPHMNNMQSARG